MKYRRLGNSGLIVSALALGTMQFGKKMNMGGLDQDATTEMISYALARGVNFIDTADVYSLGESETQIGAALKTLGVRQEIVLATKARLPMNEAQINHSGATRVNILREVDASLKRLQTDYIDLYQMHGWDSSTPLEETLRTLDDLVRAGKVLYVGVSDAPAWVVSAANVLSELRGWTPFVGLQIEYSLLQRTPERDLLPMARHFGLSVLAWGPLGAGVLTGKYTRASVENDSLRKTGNEQRGRTKEESLSVARAVDAVADEIGATSTQVALAWVRAQGYGFLPIVGARKLEQLTDSLGATDVSLSDAHLQLLSDVSRIELGFPHDFLASDGVRNLVRSEVRGRLDGRPG